MASGRRHRTLLLALLALAPAARASAQLPEEPPRWRLLPVVDPLVGGQFDVGLGAGATWARAARERPWLVDGALTAVGRYGINGSRSLTLVLDAPGLSPDWRLLGLVRTERLLRTPYFGPNDEERRTDSLVHRYGDLYYRYALLRSTLFLTAQRRVNGPLWLHAAFQARHYRTAALRQTTLYGADVAAAQIVDTVRHNGFEGRLGAVVDSRDDWIIPTRGAYLEAVGAAGWLVHDPSGKAAYQRWMLGGREYLPLVPGRTILALRQRLAIARDTLPFYLAWEQLTSWNPDDGVVGSRFVRLHEAGTRLASNDAILSVDLRRQMLNIGPDPQPIRLWAIVFTDLGLLWEPHTRPGSQQGQWTAGTGFRLQPTRSTLVGVDVGMTDIGFHLSVLSYFSF